MVDETGARTGRSELDALGFAGYDPTQIASAGPVDGPETPDPSPLVLRALRAGRRWFRAFRRTRPFWGGLWSILAGLWIIKMMSFSFALAVTGGWNYSAGYIIGGGMAMFGLIAWLRPHYRSLCGVLVFFLSLAAFVNANLGGLLVGTILGIVGGSMIWAWGEKKPRSSGDHDAEAAREEVEAEGAPW